jgi:hypothetical protein
VPLQFVWSRPLGYAVAGADEASVPTQAN